MAHPVAVRTHAHTQTQQANFIIAPMLLAGGDAQLHSFHSHFLVHIRVLRHSGGSDSEACTVTALQQHTSQHTRHTKCTYLNERVIVQPLVVVSISRLCGLLLLLRLRLFTPCYVRHFVCCQTTANVGVFGATVI